MVSRWNLIELNLIDLNFNFFHYNYEHNNSLCQINIKVQLLSQKRAKDWLKVFQLVVFICLRVSPTSYEDKTIWTDMPFFLYGFFSNQNSLY